MAFSNGPGPIVAALFEGICPGCDGDIFPDDEIVKVDGEWLCSDCAGTSDRPVTRRPGAQPPAATSTDDMGY